MNLELWSKSFLSIYNLLPSIIKSIDNLILFKGVNSGRTSFNGFASSTLEQVEEVISLSQRKVNLINLKVLTDETLLELDKEYSKILILRFIDNLEVATISNVLNIHTRTFYRRADKALKKFQEKFKEKILNNQKLKMSFNEESFLEDIFRKINLFQAVTQNGGSFSKNSESVLKFIINRLSTV